LISDITPKINESFKLVRSSDGFYKGDKSIKVKKSFEFIIQHLDCDLNNKKVLDIGCAGGDFLRYIKNNYKGAQLFGCDVDDTLLDHAKSNSTDITFF
jgi:2-polyprenyl-3-methyl-5-hydroxy-6-metoxy-1,4-benzoquinol methylase